MKLPIDYANEHWTIRRKAREAYIKLQGGKCYWCDHPLDDKPPASVTNHQINWELFPEGFLNNPIHLQHCHKTGMSEGAVHAYCNAVMWQYYGR